MNWRTLKQASLDDILAWAQSAIVRHQGWDSAQDAEWHSEGDVWTHTKMVCQQLAKLEDWSTLTSDEQTVLLFTALFHDAAKPLTSECDPETGRITSPKHAVKGEHLTRAILRDLDCDLATREQIARLVRFHGRPAFLLARSAPIHEAVRLSWLVSNRLLYLFALADTRGRDTDSMTRPEENLHYWKLLAEENGCYAEPYPFANDHARFLFFRQREPNLLYVPHEAFACRVTVLAGLPGSGKDTWLARNRSDLPVVSLDDIRGELDVAPTNILKQTRQRWIDLLADYNARIELVYIEPPFERLRRQNKGRKCSVPEPVVRKLAAKCEPPTWSECHTLLLVEGETG